MHQDDKLILSLWAKGKGGANQRLARRAWTVLKDGTDRPRDGLGLGWANAADDSEWVRRFHRMGLVGLFDSPRTGRPSVYESDVNEKLHYVKELAGSSMASAPEARKLLLGDLNRHQKEALWRALRSRGETALRSTHGQDLTVNAPEGLHALIAVVLTPRLKWLAFMPKPNAHLSDTKGSLVGVTKVRSSVQVIGGVRSSADLIQALHMDLLPPKRVLEDADLFDKRMLRREKYFLHRATSHLVDLATRYPGRIAVHLFADMTTPANLMDVLSAFRTNQLWRQQHYNKRSEGLLKDLRVVPFGRSWVHDAQTTLATYLEEAPENDLTGLFDALTLTRRVSFCWLRQEESHEPDEESNWLGREGLDDLGDS
jgi:hypothetical protein